MLRHLIDGWDRFFFAPCDYLPLGVFRFLFGLMIFQCLIMLLPDIGTWYGTSGVVTAETVLRNTTGLTLNVLNFSSDDSWVFIVFLITCCAALSFAVGYQTRLSCIILYLGLTSFHHRNPIILHGGDNFFQEISFYLMFSQAHRAFSLDELLRRRSQAGQQALDDAVNLRHPGPWAHRLIQIQMCLVYAHTVYSKIQFPMWRDGTAVYYSSRLLEFFRFPVPYIFDQLWICQLLTYATLGVETALFTLIWWRPVRYYVLLLGIALHLGIEYTMNVPQFEWGMIATYVLFVDSVHIRSALQVLKARLTARGNLGSNTVQISSR